MTTHLVLTIIEAVALAVFAALLIFPYNSKRKKTIQLVSTIALFLTNVIQLPIEVVSGKEYGLTIASIVIWAINLILLLPFARKKN